MIKKKSNGSWGKDTFFSKAYLKTEKNNVNMKTLKLQVGQIYMCANLLFGKKANTEKSHIRIYCRSFYHGKHLKKYVIQVCNAADYPDLPTYKQ